MTAPDPALHPSTFIDEELSARGWNRDDLAERMPGDTATNKLILDMYAEVGPTDPRCRLGVTSASLGEAFDISITFFVRLEALWLASAK
jgi:hypothetical protein